MSELLNSEKKGPNKFKFQDFKDKMWAFEIVVFPLIIEVISLNNV